MNTQKTELAVQLIDSTFTAEDAREVMLALIDHKIGFHHRKRFSNEERHGEDLTDSRIRIEELKAERKRMVEFFEQLNGERNIAISGLVQIAESAVAAEQKTA